MSGDWAASVKAHREALTAAKSNVDKKAGLLASATATETIAEKTDVTNAKPDAIANATAALTDAQKKLAAARQALLDAKVELASAQAAVDRDDSARTPLKHWPGMVLTLFALSLGGPFWFDALGKLVNVRAAGGKPAETPPPSKASAVTPAAKAA